MSRILIIDDEAILRDAAAEALRRAGHEVDAFDAGRPALDAFARAGYDLVISDLRMPGMDGVAVLEEARRLAPDVPFIIVTAFGTVETAVGAMKKGAYDFIIKPYRLEELEALSARALEHRQLSVENEALRVRVGDAEGGGAVWSGATFRNSSIWAGLKLLTPIARILPAR